MPPDLARELTAFPGSKRDDKVDANSQALKWLNEPIPCMGMYLYMKEQYALKKARGEI